MLRRLLPTALVLLCGEGALPGPSAPPPARMRLREEALLVRVLPGPAVDVRADFRFEGGDRSGVVLDFPEDDRTPYRDFRVTVETGGVERPLPSRKERAPDGHLFDFRVGLYPVRYVTPVPPRTGDLVVHVRYRADLPCHYREGYKGEQPSGRVLHYLLLTGSTWGGRLDRLDVRVEPGPYRCDALQATARSIQGACAADGAWRHEARGGAITGDLELLVREP